MRNVGKQDMQAVYDAMKTPHKRGFVLLEDGVNIDCATVFWHGGEWRMIFARHDPREPAERQGYETWMARSADLLKWEAMGRVLSQRGAGWDSMQADGGILLLDPDWEGSHEPERFGGKYWMSYIGGALPGYEPDPLHIGMACSASLDRAEEWARLPEPVLRAGGEGAREFESATLYKSTVVRDPALAWGAPFVMFYNAKHRPYGIEEIGAAVSDDMLRWRRVGDGSVVKSGRPADAWNIAGDPQIIRFGELWVMHFFVAYADKATGPRAYDTFAVSRDLKQWENWDGQPLIEPSGHEDRLFAHKPFVLRHSGVAYHFYCAVGDKGRGLALATSEPL
ncbi:MAG: hypothetical protein LBJ10_01305 [Clostridiales bacterium]|jgi:predicted GH43/DUF377 family glycosyl hydrolase|nr:hypothetical protein [Clostridiales bacterium]